VRPPKKTVMWIGNTPRSSPLVVPANSSTLDSVLDAGALALRPFTILRMRGVLVAGSDQGAATEDWIGVYGMMIVTDSASAIGITAIPTPVTEPESSWSLYIPVAGSFRFASGVGIDAQAATVFPFDSKAMRKVGIDDDLVGVIQNFSGADGLQVHMVGRTLIQLH